MPPLVELHRHLDGNVRLSTILDLARRHRLPLPANDEEGLRPHVQLLSPQPDLVGFLARFELLRRVMVDEEAIARIARENVLDAAAEGIDHVELRFSPLFMAEEHGLDPTDVAAAVADGVAAGNREAGEAAPGVPRARLVGILSRTYGPAGARRELEALLACRAAGRDRGLLVAIDLAGDEVGFPGELFVEHFASLRTDPRAEGLHAIAHAGEAAGPESVRQALDGLGAERIGHGVRAIEDPALVDRLVAERVPLEVCPTSNVHTSTVADYASHPLPELLERGVVATLNTDDPSISGIDLPHEYRVAREELGLDEPALDRLRENALEASFLSPAERRALAAAAG